MIGDALPGPYPTSTADVGKRVEVAAPASPYFGERGHIVDYDIHKNRARVFLTEWGLGWWDPMDLEVILF